MPCNSACSAASSTLRHDGSSDPFIPLGERSTGRCMHDVVVLVPTRHEASNVTAVAQRVETTLAATGLSWRLVFVDDSDDETVAVLAGLAAVSCHISVLHRPPAERGGGLAGAGLARPGVAESRWVAVMDADLQHPPELLAELLQPLQA